MKLAIIVKPNARKNSVDVREDGSLVVYVSTPAIEGQANVKAIEVLAEHFRKRKRDIVIVSGSRSKHKIVEIQ